MVTFLGQLFAQKLIACECITLLSPLITLHIHPQTIGQSDSINTLAKILSF